MSRLGRLRFLLGMTPLLVAASASAESALTFRLPERFEEIAATTYDPATGTTLGGGFIRVERREGGRVRMEAATGIDGGANTRVIAEFSTSPGGTGLRLLRQESRSVDVSGQPMGVLEIDHAAGEGRCTGPSLRGAPPETETIPLPDDDRIVNVPLNLLFQPIVLGEAGELRFQILLCAGGPRIVTAIARAAETEATRRDGARLVRIQYELSLPKILSRVFARWLPDLSFWFDPHDAGAWIGHEMPLYSKGPTVLLVRRGFTPALLGFEP